MVEPDRLSTHRSRWGTETYPPSIAVANLNAIGLSEARARVTPLYALGSDSARNARCRETDVLIHGPAAQLIRGGDR